MSQFIEWRHDGRRLVIPVIIYPPVVAELNGVAAQALLDTGSTTSAVTTRLADTLGLRRLGKRPLGSAQGEGQADRFLFRVGIAIAIDQQAAPRFPYVFEEVRGFELANSFSLDALIGMDILRQCRFEMQPSGRCRLTFG